MARCKDGILPLASHLEINFGGLRRLDLAHEHEQHERYQLGAIMAKESRPQAAAFLRALTHRISSTPAKQLPHIAPQIAATLWNCRSILSTPGDTVKASSETSQAVNRFRATVSQLLQARSVEERWAAVFLAKATIEAGGPEIVRKATGWTKNLVAILKKNDPSTTKVLAIITLTRIFMLTWEDTNLVREITTPALPGFVQACLTASEKTSVSANVLQATLEVFATLVPRHPTIFRTYESQIHHLLLRILSTTASGLEHDRHYAADHHTAARRLFVLLHHCAPKQGGSEKWDETLGATMTAAHATCDRVFRSVHETWRSNAGIAKTKGVSAGEQGTTGPDALGLPAWHGMYAGAERLATLVQILQAHIECVTSSTVSVRLGLVADLLNRILGLEASIRDDSASFNAEVSKDEREMMFSILPAVHVAALELMHTILGRFGHAVVSIVPHITEMLTALFAAESSNNNLRQMTYSCLTSVLNLVGPSLTKDSIADLSLIIRTHCTDLLPTTNGRDRVLQDNLGLPAHQQPATNGVSGSEKLSYTSRQPTTLAKLQTTASDLFPILFTRLDQSLVPANVRGMMEKTAVLTGNKDALVACVLNPAKKSHGSRPRPSLLPLLAREYPDCVEVEALLRPRMPPVAGTDGGGRVSVDGHFEEGSSDGGEEQYESGEEQSEDEDDASADEGATDGQGGETKEDLQAVIDTGAEEVFSTAPEQASGITGAQQSSRKRPTESKEPTEETNAKRLRASPVATALDPVSAPAPDAAAMADVPVTAVAKKVDVTEAVTLPASQIDSKDDDDESDFEIPPLTMESGSEMDEDEAVDRVEEV